MPLLRRRPLGWDEDTPDEALVGAAQRGQREAFGRLYDRHQARVYGYCYRCLGNREAAQDATGETFRKALAALPAYRSRAFRAWLFAIAHNVIADELRARRSGLPIEAAHQLADAAPSPEDLAVSGADLDSVVALLARLPADQGHAVALRLAGLNPAEIASVLGKSRAAVDMALHRAVVRLRDLMAAATEPARGGGRRD